MEEDVKKMWKTFIPKSWIWLKDYSWDIFRKDLMAGATVGIVALPLAMAFAIASGVSPDKGLYTAIIAGFLISLLGGSRTQVGGPTGAFVVIVYAIIQRHGYEGLVFSTLIAGIILIVMGFFRLGSLIKFIPYPLVTGFTSGIAIVIFSTQIKDFLGIKLIETPAGFINQWIAYIKALPTMDFITFAVAGGTLLLIILVRHFIPSIPWGIAGIVVATLFCYIFSIPVETISTRFGDIPRTLPTPSFPSLHNIDFRALRTLIPDGFVIAFLAGIESLLSAVVADSMMGTKHKSNCELVAQGCANIGSMLFGGIPATGALARTATNIKSGGRTPVAGMFHSMVLLLIMLIFAPIVGKIPLPALSAILVMVAWNMSEIDSFKRLLKAPRGDVIVLLITFLLTVLVDLTVAVQIGLIISAFVFVKRMSELSTKVTRTLAEIKEDEIGEGEIFKKHVPPGVEVYEISGPFFFGVVDSLKDALYNMEKPPKVCILRMRRVPMVDATGIHALKEFFYKCEKDKTVLILSEVKGDPAKSLKKAGMNKLVGEKNIFHDIDSALERSKELTINAAK